MKRFLAVFGIFLALLGSIALPAARPGPGQAAPWDGVSPHVISVSPKTGPTTGGFTITLTGADDQ